MVGSVLCATIRCMGFLGTSNGQEYETEQRNDTLMGGREKGEKQILGQGCGKIGQPEDPRVTF